MSSCFAIFHLNLAFSALPEKDRITVIDRCYAPLLDLIERLRVPLGIECSGWTLEQIASLAPDWVARFRRLLGAKRCSLIGSGYVQLIGPLVPYAVNHHNQLLGLDRYREILGVKPELVLVNEMAFSASLVDVYQAIGYRGIVMDKDNVELARGADLSPMGPWIAQGTDDARLPVLWSDSILFQKFQRVVHGDLIEKDYWDYVTQPFRIDQALPLYCGDGEIFGFRPRRYHYESHSDRSAEWQRLERLLDQARKRFKFVRAEEALVTEGNSGQRALRLNTAAFPIPVKKQPKYNVARWAVSGRDDLYLNTLCHRLLASLEEHDFEGYRRLCMLWSSDLRTHIVPDRFTAALAEANDFCGERGIRPLDELTPKKRQELPAKLVVRREGMFLFLSTPQMELCLDTRRGLAVRSWFVAGLKSLIGTIPHGHFRRIDLGADFYTGGTVIELPGKLKRITDLERVEPEINQEGDRVVVRASLDTSLGTLEKWVALHLEEAKISLGYAFPGWERPHGTVRLGHITLLPNVWQKPISYACHLGGKRMEPFFLEDRCMHVTAPSSLISCTTGLGATNGHLRLSDGKHQLTLDWDPAFCAAFPMIWHQPCHEDHLTRVVFSLSELDDTRARGGRLLPFEVQLSQRQKF